MGINLEKMAAKIKKMKEGGRGGGDSRLFRPDQKGEKVSVIRFIDYPYDNDDCFIELWFHYRIGKGKSILCPRKNWGKTCPICEWAKSIVNNNPIKEDEELAKDLWPTQRFFAVVVDREDETLTPKFYGFGRSIYYELFDKLNEAEYKDYMDPQKGIDVSVKCKKEGDKKYPTTSLTFSRRDTPLAEDESKIKEIIASITQIDEIFKPLTTAEIKDRLNEWLDWKSEDPEAKSGEETRGGNGTADEKADSEEPTESESSSAESVDDEFERALKEAQAAQA